MAEIFSVHNSSCATFNALFALKIPLTSMYSRAINAIWTECIQFVVVIEFLLLHNYFNRAWVFLSHTCIQSIRTKNHAKVSWNEIDPIHCTVLSFVITPKICFIDWSNQSIKLLNDRNWQTVGFVLLINSTSTKKSHNELPFLCVLSSMLQLAVLFRKTIWAYEMTDYYQSLRSSLFIIDV